MTGYKHNQLKNKSFDDTQKLFNKAMKRVNTFVDMDTELVEDKDKETVELQRLIEIVHDKEEVAIDAFPLATKPPSIVDYKIDKEGKKTYYQIIRADGSLKMYLVFSHMLKSFDREDLETLWKLVKAKHGSTSPEEGYERVLWGDLKTMFNPHGRTVRIKSLHDDLEVTAAKYAQALSSIPAIVDRYMDNKLGEAINKAIQAHNFDCREEAQAEKKEYIELVDSTVRTIIKEEVNTQLPQILPQAISDAAASLSDFELTKILIDKMEKNKSHDKADYKKKLYDALVESYNTNKDLFDSLKMSRDDRDQYRDPFARSDRGTKRRKSSKDAKSSRDLRDNDEQPADKEVTKAGWFKKPEQLPTPDPDWNYRGCQIIPKDYFINKDLEYLKGGDLSRRYSTLVTKTKAATYELKWIKDLGPKCQSFYGYASNLTSSKDVYSKRRIIAVTMLKFIKKYDYGHLEEIKVSRDDQKLYTFKEGDFKRLRLQDIEDMLLLLVQQKLTNLTIDERRKRLMRADELHKFSDGTLNDVRFALHEIVAGIRKEYLPMRKWSCGKLEGRVE
ncbi:hypothetical protein Tco_0222151 [Tanacetum coccineum]